MLKSFDVRVVAIFFRALSLWEGEREREGEKCVSEEEMNDEEARQINTEMYFLSCLSS